MTNLQQLYELIKPVEWEDDQWRFALAPAPEGYQDKACRYWWRTLIDKDDGCIADRATWWEYEAQALIQQAAIEWLEDRSDILTIERDNSGWRVVRNGWCCVAGALLLLDALLAAVEAVKEKADGG